MEIAGPGEIQPARVALSRETESWSATTLPATSNFGLFAFWTSLPTAMFPLFVKDQGALFDSQNKLPILIARNVFSARKDSHGRKRALW